MPMTPAIVGREKEKGIMIGCGNFRNINYKNDCFENPFAKVRLITLFLDSREDKNVN